MKKLLLTITILVFSIYCKAQVYQNLQQTTNNTETLKVTPFLHFFHQNYLYYSDGGGGTTLYRLNLNNLKTEISGLIPTTIINPTPTMQGNVVIANNVYLLSTGGAFNKYNVLTKVFSSLQSCPSLFNYGPAAMTYDGIQYIYLWGGSQYTGASWPNQYSPSNQLWRYDIINDVWFQLSTTSISSFGRNGYYVHPYLYFTSGGNYHDWNQIRVYNVVSGLWSILTRPFPLNLGNGDYWNLSQGPVMFKNGIKSYIFGSWGLTQFSYELHEFNPLNQTFTGGLVNEFTTNYTLKGQCNTNKMNIYSPHTYKGATYALYGGYNNRDYNQAVRAGDIGLIRVHPKRVIYVSVDSTNCFTPGIDSIDLFIRCELAGNFINNNLKLIYTNGVDSSVIFNINNWSSNGTQYLNRTKRVKYFSNGALKAIAYSSSDTINSVNEFPIITNIKSTFNVNYTLSRSANFCQNELIGLYVVSNVSFSGPRATIWQSKVNNNWVDILSNSNDITIINQGKFRCKVLNNTTGCIAYSDSFEVKVLPSPVINLTTNKSPTICAGDNVTISTTHVTGNTYIWKKNGTNITGANSSSFIANSDGLYTLEVTNTNGCKALSSEVSVTTNQLPTVSINSNNITSTCVGNNLALTSSSVSNATGGLTYQWYRSGTIISGATSSTYSAAISGPYTLEVTNSNGCKSISNSINIVANLLPTVSISYSGSNMICVGSNLQLNSASVANATGSLAYQWKKDGIVINGANSSTYSASNSGVYTLEVTNSNGCKATSSAVTISTIPIPIVNVTASSSMSICVGNTVSLNSTVTANASGNVTYQWKKNGINISNATSSTYTASTAGTYTLEVTNSNWCKATSNSLDVIVNNPPSINISSNGVNGICVGGAVLLNSSAIANAPGSLTYQWKKDGIIINGANSSTYNATIVGQYSLEVINSNGCQATSSSVNLSTNILPTVSIATLNPTTFCAGDSAVLTSNSLANASGNLNYQWKKDGINIIGQTSPTLTAKMSGQYSLEVINSNGCQATSSNISLTRNLIPIINITNTTPTNLCIGDFFTLSSVVNGNSNVGVTYQWKKDGFNINGATDSTYTTFDSGTYTIEATNINGCKATSSPINLIFNQLPTTAISSNGINSFCTGDTVALSSTSITNASGVLTYQWKKDGVNINGATNSTYNATLSGKYSLVVLNSNGCQGTSSNIILTSYLLPTVDISSSSTTICLGDSIILKSSSAANAIGSLVYQWKKNDINITGAIDSNYKTSEGGRYTLSVTNNNGCFKTSNSISILVDSFNLGKIIGDTSNIIPNNTYNYSIQNLTSNNYNWIIENGVIVSGQSTNAVNVKWLNKGNAKLTCVISNINNCIYTANLGFNIQLTGVNDIKKSNIIIYPNPTNNIINIEGLSKNENKTIQIFDVQGKLVITKTIIEKGTIDLSELNKGVYVIKVGEVAQRIVKM